MADRLLNDEITGQIRDVFKELSQPVHVLYFGRKQDCDYCPETEQLLSELVEISDALSLEIRDLDQDAELAARYRVDKAPGFVMLGKNGGDELVDYGIRFSGIPSGHEFSTLIQGLILVSGRDSQLNAETRDYLKTLEKPVHLQVFVTPT